MFDTVTSARALMGMSLAFHIVFAAVGIGLPLLFLIAEGIALRTGDEEYRRMARRWARVAAVLFAVGAVSGTILSFEFGLLWPTWIDFSGGIIGFIFGSAALIAFLTNAGYGLKGTRPYVIVAGIFLICLVSYWIGRAYNKSRGIDVNYAFLEVPPE